MRLGYFTRPVHPAERKWHETLQEDREAVILADRLGFHEAFNEDLCQQTVEQVKVALGVGSSGSAVPHTDS